MARIKLTKEIKYTICDIIAEELYNMHIKDKMDNIQNMQQIFISLIKKEYYRIFNYTDEVINFCKKYNLYDTNRLYIDGYNNNYPATDRMIFKRDNGFVNDYINSNGYYVEFSFPLFSKLNYKYINNQQETFNTKLYNEYAKYIFPLVKEVSDVSKIVKKDYLNFKEVVLSCIYVDEIEKFVPFENVKKFLESKYFKKLSTELCTINEEKIDFVKNYLKNKK